MTRGERGVGPFSDNKRTHPLLFFIRCDVSMKSGKLEKCRKKKNLKTPPSTSHRISVQCYKFSKRFLFFLHYMYLQMSSKQCLSAILWDVLQCRNTHENFGEKKTDVGENLARSFKIGSGKICEILQMMRKLHSFHLQSCQSCTS